MERETDLEAVAAGAEPDHRALVPWEDPELSALAGFFHTLREVLFRPGEFFANLGREGWAEPLAFGLIASSLGLLGAFFWLVLVRAPAGLSPGWVVALMAGAPVLALANLGMSGICWWGSVALMGAGRDFIPSWRIFCYAQAGMALGLIPFFGMLVAGIWVPALLYCGVKQVYGLSTGGSLGALAVFLSLQAALALIFFLGLAGTLTFLTFLVLLG